MISGTIAVVGAGASTLSFSEEPACAKYCPNLSFRDRIIGFTASAGIGWLLSFIGTMTLLGGPSAKNITSFAVLYVLGNVTALCATGFLLGPRSQCRYRLTIILYIVFISINDNESNRKMWDPTRRYTTAFYLIMLIIVFSVALAVSRIYILCIFILIIHLFLKFSSL